MAQDDIQGTVTDSAGDPVEAAIVALIPNDGSDGDDVIYTTTDSNGDYIFDAHPQGDGTTQEWHVMARYDDGSGEFNSLSLPYVSADLPETAPIPDSGISRYTLDDGDTDGSTSVDTWGDNDATINGPTTGVSGANQTYNTGEAYEWDGTDDYVETPAAIIPSGSKSIAFWWRYSSLDSGDAYFIEDTTGDAADSDENQPLFYYNDDTEIRVLDTSQTTSDLITVSFTASSETWYHVVYTFDSSTDTWEIYVDGSSQGTNSSADCKTDHQNWRIGSGNDTQAFNGQRFDDIRFYSKALSGSEVDNLYNTGSISG